MVEFFLKGFVLGFAIAAPVGPIGILCIRKTLQFGKLSGISSGLGAAAADTLFGSLAAFGMTFLSDQIMTYGSWLKLVGSFFLLFLSYRSFCAHPREPNDRLHKMSYLKDFIGTFFLTLTNPLTILCYLAVFAAIGLTDIIGVPLSGVFLVSGVFIGASFWWLILIEGVGLFRHKLDNHTMTWINRIAGIVIGAFGIWSLTTLFINRF
ncbi:MAG: putative threonine efflux protein [Parachlamydiales bacterium]|nr:putative threonine efflux protein [Parachlamydiales bacterium]